MHDNICPSVILKLKKSKNINLPALSSMYYVPTDTKRFGYGKVQSATMVTIYKPNGYSWTLIKAGSIKSSPAFSKYICLSVTHHDYSQYRSLIHTGFIYFYFYLATFTISKS